MTQRLEDSTVDDALKDSGWRRDGSAIVRDWEFKDFAEAWEFADGVAKAAEAADHHPDILAHGWNKVRVTVTTHSAGGITVADLSLAQAIDAI